MEWLFPATCLSPWRVVLEAKRFHLDEWGNLSPTTFSLHLQVLFDLSSLGVFSVFMATDSASSNFLLQSKVYLEYIVQSFRSMGIILIVLALFVVKNERKQFTKDRSTCKVRQRFPSLSLKRREGTPARIYRFPIACIGDLRRHVIYVVLYRAKHYQEIFSYITRIQRHYRYFVRFSKVLRNKGTKELNKTWLNSRVCYQARFQNC